MSPAAVRERRKRPLVLAMEVDPVDLEAVVERVARSAGAGKGGRVCVANVHMCIECLDSPEFAEVVNGADLVVADGRPIWLGLRLLGHKHAGHVRGADLTLALLRRAAASGLTVGFYGGSPQVLDRLVERVRPDHPGLRIGCAISPPFRPLTAAEEGAYIDQINHSGTQILFVGLGCPKQEEWMARHGNDLRAVAVGVGAVFDFLSGEKPMAPRWMQRLSLEWLHRLASEPGRLWRRYLYTNPRFLWHFSRQLLGARSRSEAGRFIHRKE